MPARHISVSTFRPAGLGKVPLITRFDSFTPSLDTRIGAKNVLRVAIDGSRASGYLNDQFVMELTIQPPKVGGFFGLGSSRVNDAPAT
jgi:hypothetical protein